MENRSESFGEYLKRERNMRGVTLEEISRSTNINIRFLESIENDMYEDLPAEIFVRGFLRSYAKCIGIDQNEVLLAYSECTAFERGSNLLERDIDFIKKDERNKKIIVSAAIICFLVAGLFISYFINSHIEQPSSEPASITQHIEQKEKAPVSENLKKQSPKKHEITQKTEVQKKISKKKSPENQKEKEPAPESETLTLTIYASEDVWLKVETDGEDIQEALLHEGEQVTYRAEDEFLLTLGNISGSIVNLNGEEITLPESKYNILRDFEIARETIQTTEDTGQTADQE